MKKQFALLFTLLIISIFSQGIININPAYATITFVFNPNDLIQMFPSTVGSNVPGGMKVDQLNARRLHNPWAKTMYETFYNPDSPQPQPNSYNTYMNWRDGLGANEGISGFNIWLLDNARARSWGENVVWNPVGPAPTGTADASGLWKVETIANPWGPGWIVQWWTDDPANYLNAASNIGNFSFSGTAYRDVNANGYDSSDPILQIGEVARIWFGAVNWTEADGQGGWDYEWSLHFDDQGWGTRLSDVNPFSAGFLSSAGYGSGYEGVLDITAIPEPGTFLLLGFGLLGLAGLSRKKFFKK